MAATNPAVTTKWTGRARDGVWVDPANWSTGVPAAGEVARFARNATVDLGGTPHQAGQIAVVNDEVLLSDGTLRIVDAAYLPALRQGVELRVDGGATMAIAAGASVLGQALALVGDRSAGSLSVYGVLTDSDVILGRTAQASVIVSGAQARWHTTDIDQSFQVGGAGGASLVVADGAHVDDGKTDLSQGAATTMTIGGYGASGSVSVTGCASLVRFQILDVGGSYSGSLTVAAGAHVLDDNGNVGQTGDGTVDISGAGSLWQNRSGLFIGGTIPHGTVSITDHATVTFGDYGLQLQGTLLLDSTAVLKGSTIVMAGGALTALATACAAQSTVTVTQSIELGYNYSSGAANIGSFVGSAAGATLELSGTISPFGFADPLAVGGGHVVLDNPHNGDFVTDLYGGVLELAHPGSGGSGGISFVDGYHATLQVDQAGTLSNPISGFGSDAGDVIDLHALVYGPHVALTWQQASAQGGTLEVTSGLRSETLALSGSYSQSGFVLSNDGTGRTAISYAPAAHV